MRISDWSSDVMATKDTSASLRTRRDILKGASVLGGGLLAAPFVSRMAFAAPVELTMLAWYGHAEPDVVAEFEAANNVKFKPNYYTEIGRASCRERVCQNV